MGPQVWGSVDISFHAAAETTRDSKHPIWDSLKKLAEI
jgi:hypothetical protein